jgi:putative ABC transport system substrate-binding protein
MKRRELLALIAGTLAAPVAGAQSPDRPRRVHVLHQGTPADAEPLRKALLEGLQARGWRIGRDLHIEEHHAEGRQANLAPLAVKIVRAAPDLIVVSGPATAVEVKKLGASIPVVFIAVFDPVGLGLAQSLARPGGSFTGLSTAVPETFFGKQLELLREAVPRVARVAVLSNPRNPIHVLFRDRRLKGLSDNGLEGIEVHAASREELEPAFREAARAGAGAMYVGGDPLTTSNRSQIAELALRHRLPTMFLFHRNVEAGGLMSYGTDLADLQRRSVEYVDRILRGARPADLPIAQPVKFDLVINLGTAKALGLKIPQSLLLRADRVIE